MRETRKDYWFNGHLRSIINYKDDKLQGLCQIWHENGILIEERNFKNGLVIR